MESSRQPAGRGSRLIWLTIAAPSTPDRSGAGPAGVGSARRLADGLLVVFPFVGSLRRCSNIARSPPTRSGLPRGRPRPRQSPLRRRARWPARGERGFNRHAIHHWEPQLSYTRLADLEPISCAAMPLRCPRAADELRNPSSGCSNPDRGAPPPVCRVCGAALGEVGPRRPTPSTAPPPSGSPTTMPRLRLPLDRSPAGGRSGRSTRRPTTHSRISVRITPRGLSSG